VGIKVDHGPGLAEPLLLSERLMDMFQCMIVGFDDNHLNTNVVWPIVHGVLY
jgi:hypothetical protein